VYRQLLAGKQLPVHIHGTNSADSLLAMQWPSSNATGGREGHRGVDIEKASVLVELRSEQPQVFPMETSF